MINYRESKLILSQIKLLRTLILGTLFLASLSLVLNLFFFLRSKLFSNYSFYGDSPLNVIGFLSIFIYLYYLIQKNLYRYAAIGLVLTYVCIGFYSSVKWGADVPFAFLIYALAIMLAGISLSGRHAIATNLVIIVGLSIIIYLQKKSYIDFDYSWTSRKLDLVDNITTGLILSIVALVSWLSNREIHYSFNLARKTERALIAEKNNLEFKVIERTRDLEKIQMEKMIQVYRLAELGKIAGGLIHEIVNPLTSVSISLEQLDNSKKSSTNRKQINTVIQRAISGTKEMERYVRATRRQIQKQEIYKNFNITDSIVDCIKIFSYRVKTENVRIITNIDQNSNSAIYGDPIKFHHIINNLISNSFDALSEIRKKSKHIIIETLIEADHLIIKVEDNGKGISKSEIQKVFRPFFTTKKDHGTGIGLAITKDIIEKNFGGKIGVVSKLNSGTTFTIQLPLQQKNTR